MGVFFDSGNSIELQMCNCKARMLFAKLDNFDVLDVVGFDEMDLHKLISRLPFNFVGVKHEDLFLYLCVRYEGLIKTREYVVRTIKLKRGGTQ